MVTFPTLQEAPRLDEFLAVLEAAEGRATWYPVGARSLVLDADGFLRIPAGPARGIYSLSPRARRALATLAEIPTHYFEDCTPDLRAINFEHRFYSRVPRNHVVQIAIDGDTITDIRDDVLLIVPKLTLLETIADDTPPFVSRDEVRVLQYGTEPTFDVSLIEPALACQPRQGDVVAFGLNVAVSPKGSVQIQSASYRCVCRNGALTRICDKHGHRIRRPHNRSGRLAPFLETVARHAREAWTQWKSNADALASLARRRLDDPARESLQTSLTRAPFHLAKSVARQVFSPAAADEAEGSPVHTYFDVWNRMTRLGTHTTALRYSTRRKLRAGAGEFIRSPRRVCPSCRQVVAG